MKEKLTNSLEDYLEAIYLLQQDNAGARVKDISDKLSVRMPSVNTALSVLKQAGLVNQEPYGAVTLTDEGSKIAQEVLYRHNFIKALFIKLGVSEDVAEADACRVEHNLSDETFTKLVDYFKDK